MNDEFGNGGLLIIYHSALIRFAQPGMASDLLYALAL